MIAPIEPACLRPTCRVIRRTLSPLALLIGCLLALPAAHAVEDDYRFKVYLDRKEIGWQHFSVASQGDSTRASIEARFEVKLWFISAYHYTHTVQETWKGSCLTSVEASTDDNGDQQFVRASALPDGGLAIRSATGAEHEPRCVSTFAYWNLDRLRAPRLLNLQTGKMQAAQLQPMGEDTLAVRGQPQHTQRYRLTSEKLVIDLWYTPDGRWVALQSPTEHGRLRYELQ